MTDLTQRFPDILPMEEIRVTDEEHEYEVKQDANGNRIEKERYVPNKAPILELEGITGTVNGDSYTFVRGTDFAVTDTDNDGRDETIDFSIGGNNPDDNTTFRITYIAESIVLRFTDSFGDEFHRFRRDITEAIESHYVDEASESGYIDNFEDEEIVEYTFQSGGPSNAFVQSSTVFQGNWALCMQSPSAGTPVRIVSDVGLPRYPQRGDTLEYYYRFGGADDIGHFDFMYTESSAGTQRYYRVTADANNDTFVLQKEPNSAKQSSASVSFGQYQGDWIQITITIDPLGDITADLIDGNGSVVASVTITDGEYTSGGIRWAAENPNGPSDSYFDAADITKRVSGDLDRVGAIFGELGKRRGRTDDEYQTFLRSIVQSFAGRGTKDGIKFAVASAIGIDPSKITISEDFANTAYTVNIQQPWPQHSTVTIAELAELADPSGVDFADISYQAGDDTMEGADSVGSDITASNTTALRYDTKEYDTFDYDTGATGSTQESAVTAEELVVASNATPKSYDAEDYDTINYDGKDGDDVSESSDSIAATITASPTDTSDSSDTVTVTISDVLEWEQDNWGTEVWG